MSELQKIGVINQQQQPAETSMAGGIPECRIEREQGPRVTASRSGCPTPKQEAAVAVINKQGTDKQYNSEYKQFGRLLHTYVASKLKEKLLPMKL
jgi:hypothetical protein